MAKYIDWPTRKLKRRYWKAIRAYWRIKDSGWFSRTDIKEAQNYADNLKGELSRRGWYL